MITHMLFYGIIYPVEPATCNYEVNKEKKKVFGEALIRHNEQ